MVMLLLYITYKRFFFLLALVVPRPELGGRTGFERSNIYQEFLVSFFLYISLCGLWKERDFGRRKRLGLLT